MITTRLRNFFYDCCWIILIRLIIFSHAQEANDEGLFFLQKVIIFSRHCPQNSDYIDLLKNKHVTLYIHLKSI
jgi:hypothetical protein